MTGNLQKNNNRFSRTRGNPVLCEDKSWAGLLEAKWKKHLDFKSLFDRTFGCTPGGCQDIKFSGKTRTHGEHLKVCQRKKPLGGDTEMTVINPQKFPSWKKAHYMQYFFAPVFTRLL